MPQPSFLNCSLCHKVSVVKNRPSSRGGSWSPCMWSRSSLHCRCNQGSLSTPCYEHWGHNMLVPWFKKSALQRRLVQDGRVGGHALSPPCESTGITTNCWTIDRKTLKLNKKYIPHPKTKEKPQWHGRRGAITIKSTTITVGWVTHKQENTYITEVHPLEWRFWAPH